MFSSGPSFNKLKTNLRLCINRLKLLEKKKTEMALKNRKEIADYIAAGKPERAKIRVEHIVREDYLVEAMEIVEMYCDLLLARFGLIEQMKSLDDGLAEAVSSLIWVTPRLQSDVAELRIVAEQLVAKYGKPYGLACRENAVGTVSEKLMHKLSVQAPPKITVEKYLVEIAKYYNVEYEPDAQVLSQDEAYAVDALVDLAPPVPTIIEAPHPPRQPFQYPQQNGVNASYPPPQGFLPPGGAMAYPPLPPKTSVSGPNLSEKDLLELSGAEDGPPPYFPPQPVITDPRPPVSQDQGQPSKDETQINNVDLPELPVVPSDLPAHDPSPDSKDDEDVDFDDLTRRFEALKKKK